MRMLPRPSWPRAVQSGLWQNWACGSIGVPHEARFGDHAWRDAGWTRVFQAPTPESRFNEVLPPCPRWLIKAVIGHRKTADRAGGNGSSSGPLVGGWNMDGELIRTTEGPAPDRE